MKSRQPIPNTQAFTHRIYVDFSGDTGDPQKKGASKVLCIAWVLTAEEDRRHNEDIVFKMKRIIGCKPENEIKYRSIRRHPRKHEVLKYLEQLKIGAVIVPVLKERVHEAELRDPTTRKLAILLHHFPLQRIFAHLEETTPEDELSRLLMQLVFDQVAWSGFREEIVQRLQDEHNIDWRVSPKESVKFLDSKRYPLLQIADLIAGLGLEYMESVQGIQLLPCQLCWSKGEAQHHRGCPKKAIGNATLMKVLYSLLLKKDDKAFERGFIARPPTISYQYWFVDCITWR